MDTEHYTDTNIFQRAQTFQNVFQPAPGEEAVSGKNLKWLLGVWRMCQIALVSYYGLFLGCACCVMLTSSTSGRYMPALEQPFHAAGWMERRIWLNEGLETSLEKLLSCCSVLLQSLLPDLGAQTWAFWVKHISALSHWRACWIWGQGDPLLSWSGVVGCMSCHVLLCVIMIPGALKRYWSCLVFSCEMNLKWLDILTQK